MTGVHLPNRRRKAVEVGAGAGAARTAELPSAGGRSRERRATAADAVRPLLRAYLRDELPLRISFWDGSRLGPAGGPGEVVVRRPDALRRISWSPDELGFGRAFVAGDIDVQGDLYATLRALRSAAPEGLRTGLRGLPAAVAAARRLGLLGAPPPPPPEEARPQGRVHSRARDAAAISHHYDVGNDFYALVLGPSLTYSCARFETPGASLEEAQESKHDLICRKLGLDGREGLRLLDVGCGWGSLAIHAARRHGARVVGITISAEQARLAQERVEDAGLDGLVEIRLQDYRDLVPGERFDAVSSVGMFEHVGSERTAQYFATLRSVMAPRGRLLNHAIAVKGGSRLGDRTFAHRYVFPDGELQDVGRVVLCMEEAGFEVRDVESLREHYASTLRCWVRNLEGNWAGAVAAVGERRARVWRLYMAAAALGFEDGGQSVYQVLGVVTDEGGGSAMPPTRRTMV